MTRLRLRHVAEVNPSTPEFDAAPDDADVTFVPLEAVWPRALDVSRTRTKAEVAQGYTRFCEGDVLVPKITPTFEADRSTIAVGLRNGFGAGTTELHVVRPGPSIDGRYVNYLVSSRGFLLGGEAEMIGVAGQKRVPDAWLRDFHVPIQSPSAQGVIADFLDTETARIDALITKRRCMIDLLQERWRAERDRVLVDRVDVTMVPLARLTDPYRPIVYGIVQAGDHVEHGVPYIKTGDLEDFDPRRLSRTSADIDHQYRRARVHPGDLVMAMRASIGALVEIPENLPHANLTQGTARIAAAQGVSRRWLTHALGTSIVQEQCQDRAVGSTFRTLNIWDLRRVQVPTPPLQAQEELIRHLDRLEVRVREGTQAIGRQIRLLQEHRQALITAAVTGELEVPGVAA